MTGRVLLVDDDAAVRTALAQTLELAGLEALTANSFVAAKDLIRAQFGGVILSDIRMRGRDGFHLLEYAQAQDPDLPVILLTGEGDIPMAVKAMSAGAFGFLEKPCAPADLLSVLARAQKTRDLVLENRRMKQLVETGDPAARMIFGVSALSDNLRARVRVAAQTEGPVLVTGAPGSGLSKVAEVIHLCSPASKAPFVRQAAAGLMPEALDAAFDQATPGAVYLDEIGNLPAQTQLRLLEQLEGDPQARLIAASSMDLPDAVARGAFNADLYYQLEIMSLRIPALSERPEDIPVMFRAYVHQAAEQAGLPVPEVTPPEIAALMAKDWPGNARALMSDAMRFVLGLRDEGRADASLGLAEQMAQVEQSLLQTALRRANGRASDAATALKLPRKTFYDKLARYGLKPEDFR